MATIVGVLRARSAGERPDPPVSEHSFPRRSRWDTAPASTANRELTRQGAGAHPGAAAAAWCATPDRTGRDGQVGRRPAARTDMEAGRGAYMGRDASGRAPGPPGQARAGTGPRQARRAQGRAGPSSKEQFRSPPPPAKPARPWVTAHGPPRPPIISRSMGGQRIIRRVLCERSPVLQGCAGGARSSRQQGAGGRVPEGKRPRASADPLPLARADSRRAAFPQGGVR